MPKLVVLLGLESHEVVINKHVQRLCRAAGLSLRAIKQKLLRREAVPLVRLAKANQEWTLDFVHDAATKGTEAEILHPGDVWELTEEIAKRGKPYRIRMDNGSEFTGRTILVRRIGQKIEVAQVRPGKPIGTCMHSGNHGRFALRPPISGAGHDPLVRIKVFTYIGSL